MTDMTGMQYAEKIRNLNSEIDRKLQKLSELKSRSTSIGSFDYTKDRVQTSPSGEAPFVHTVDEIVNLEKEIDKLTDEYAGMRQRFLPAIRATLTDEEYDVFSMCYFDGCSWNHISACMGLGVRTCRRRFNSAVYKLKHTIYWGYDTE